MNRAMRARRPRVAEEGALRQPGLVGASDVAVATVLAVAGCVLFWIASHGASLRVTFLPGMVIVWAVILWLWRTRQPLPTAAEVLPWYLIALAVQLVHFAEEFVTGFAEQFPHRYGAAPYAVDMFVWFNMGAYAVFVVAAVALWHGGNRKLLVPVLFFVVYGTLANAVAHLTWAILEGAYFPGLYTSLAFWILGPVLGYQLLGRSRSRTLAYLGVTTSVIATLVAGFAT